MGGYIGVWEGMWGNVDIVSVLSLFHLFLIGAQRVKESRID